MPFRDGFDQKEYHRLYRLANKERLKIRQKEWYLKNRDRQLPKMRDQAYRRLYGFSLAGYDALLATQEGRCAICGVEKPRGKGKRFHLDHDHETGHVRGLLCNKCNSNLGWTEKYINSIVMYLSMPPPENLPPVSARKKPGPPREGSRLAAAVRKAFG